MADSRKNNRDDIQEKDRVDDAARRLAAWLEASEQNRRPPRALTPEEQDAALIAARLRAASKAGEPRPEFRDQLWARLEQAADTAQAGTPPARAAALSIPRRDFLRVMLGTAAGLLVGGWLDLVFIERVEHDASQQASWMLAVRLANLPVGDVQARLISERPVIVVHSPTGVYALSGTCTHEACILQPNREHSALVCPCHGAIFELNGINRIGPGGYAQELPPLPSLPVKIYNDDVYVWIG